MHKLSIDLETYSSAPIGKTGAFRYIDSPDFEILLFAYSLDNGPVTVIDVASGEAVPEWLVAALHDPEYIKRAYNAAFEWGCLSKVYGPMEPSQWRDTMLHGLYAGYTAGLDATGRALGLPEDKQKLNTGKALIRYFCVPCKPTKSNGGRTRNLPHHDPDKWRLFKEYNAQDVVTEMEIAKRLSAFPVPDMIQKQWETDLRINARGVAVDMEFTAGALEIGAAVTEELTEEAVKISGLDNPNSVKQLVKWLDTETAEGVSVENLRKETVTDLLAMGGHSDDVQRMLEIRQELGKTSTKKYDAIEMCVCSDERVRGLLQFYGANRTGRWAGRLVQVQNLPRTYIEHLDTARRFVKDCKKDHLRMAYGSVSDTLSQLIRTAFIATPGNVLIDADFSAIEARVIAWLANEEWRLEVFRTTGKIYEASAAMIYHVPVETIVKGHENYALRQRGKVAELALGYQGGVGAMRRMDVSHALDEMTDDEVQEIVNNWRNASSHIRDLWYDMENAALEVIINGGSRRVRCLTLAREFDIMQGTAVMSILLPSGRKLYYINPQVTENRWGQPSIAYYGVDQTTKKWKAIETYGGKLVENCVQAIARDCLAQAIEKLEARGFPIVFHVHDEVVIDIKPFADNKAIKEADIDCVEIDSNLRNVLEGEGFRVVHDDFLTYETQKRYRLVVMNPPFDNGAAHLLKALELMQRGGTICCILNAETLRNCYTEQRRELAAKLKAYGAEIEFVSGAFADAERQTDVDVALIRVNIPQVAVNSTIVEEMRKAPTYKTQTVPSELTELVQYNVIEEWVNRYNFEAACGIRLIEEHDAMREMLQNDIDDTNSLRSPILELHINVGGRNREAIINNYLKQTRGKYWRAIFQQPVIVSKLTGNLQQELYDNVEKLKDYEFSVYNILTLIIKMNGRIITGIEDTIIGLFDDWTARSYYEESPNHHYYNGWRTNDCFRVGKKVILPFYGAYDSWDKKFRAYNVIQKFRDIEKVFDFLDSGRTDWPGTLDAAFGKAQEEQITKNIDTKYFTVTVYKKGTAHLVFKDEDLLEKFNLFASQKKGWLPPNYGRKRYRDMSEEEKAVVDSFQGREKYEEVMARADYYLNAGANQMLMLGAPVA